MPKTILLADDSITIQKVVELTFSDGDYNVVAVNNGTRAIERLAEVQPDIILSDIIMPEKNGYEVCEYVKSHPEYRHIPVILLTGTFEPFDPDRAEKAGCDAVVTKPFESQSLIHKVEELIQQAPSRSSDTSGALHDSAAESGAGSPSEAEGWTDHGASPLPEATPFGEDAPFAAAGGVDPAPGTVDSMPSWDTADETAGGDEPFAGDSQPLNYHQGHETDTEQPSDAFGGFQSTQSADRAGEGAGDRERETPAFTEHSDSVFGSSPEPSSTPFSMEQPFDNGATQAFPKMSFDELSAMADESPSSQSEEPVSSSPWEDAPGSADQEPAIPSWGGGETDDESAAPSPWGAAGEADEQDTAPSPWEPPAEAAGAHDADTPWASSSGEDQQQNEPSPWSESTDQSQFGTSPDSGAGIPGTAPPDDGSTSMFPLTAEERGSFQQREEEGSDPDETRPGEGRSPWLSESDEDRTGAGWDAHDVAPNSDASRYEHRESAPFVPSDESSATSPFSSTGDAFAEDSELSASNDEREIDYLPQREADAAFGADIAGSDAGQDPYGVASAPEYGRSPDETSFGAGEAEEGQPPESRADQLEGAADYESREPEQDESADAWAPAASSPDIDAAAAPSTWSDTPRESTSDSPESSQPSAAGERSQAFLSDDQIEKIARRVVELMSEEAVRKIAWEVIPDMAEMVVKERLRQLESDDS